jgi:hypothetical protein
MLPQGTEHWRSYIKTTYEIGLPGMLFTQIVHKASYQVGEVELEAGDDLATEPQGDGDSTEAEEGDGDTPFEAHGEIDEGEVNEEVLR